MRIGWPILRNFLLLSSTVVLVLAISMGTSAAETKAIDRAASSDPAAINEAQQMIGSARAKYREARAKAVSDYKAKKAECDKLQGNAKKTCAGDATAARSKAIADAKAARKKAMDEAYAKAPELRPAVATPDLR
jgi:hypothetical protein